MKELSIEEKAKAYDEAIERAKEMCAMPSDRATMEYVFPELKEDERVRKFLQHTFAVQYLAKDKLGKWHGEPIINLGDMAEVDNITGFDMTFGEAKEKLIEIKDRYAE